MGPETGACLCNGSHNIIMGQYAGRGSSTVSANTASQNIALGQEALKVISSGSNNIALGQSAMGTGTVTGQQNITLGLNAGTDITSGSYNILFGRNIASGMTTGSSNIAMGTGTLGGDTALYQKLKLVKETIDANPDGPYKKILRETHGMVI